MGIIVGLFVLTLKVEGRTEGFFLGDVVGCRDGDFFFVGLKEDFINVGITDFAAFLVVGFCEGSFVGRFVGSFDPASNEIETGIETGEIGRH